MTSPSGSKNDDKNEMGWMYAGPQSIVDREKYLLGAKIDTNFELFAAKKDPRDVTALDSLLGKAQPPNSASSSSHFGLDLDTIRKEDPLVAIKVREEKVRQQLLDNPMRMKRLKKIVDERMRKKMNEMLEKCGGSERDLREGRREREGSDKGRRERDEGRDKGRRDEGRDGGRRYEGNAGGSGSKRFHHSSERERKSDYVDRKRRREDDEDERRRGRRDGQSASFASSSSSASKTFHPKKSADAKSQKPQSAPAPVRLSSEEMRKRREEMMKNAEWRERQRQNNLKMYEKVEKEENEASISGQNQNHQKPLLAAALGASDSIAGQINRRKARHEKGYDVMQRHFARK